MEDRTLPLGSFLELGEVEYEVISEAREAVEVTDKFTVMGDIFYYLRDIRSGNVYEYRGENTIRLV